MSNEGENPAVKVSGNVRIFGESFYDDAEGNGKEESPVETGESDKSGDGKKDGNLKESDKSGDGKKDGNLKHSCPGQDEQTSVRSDEVNTDNSNSKQTSQQNDGQRDNNGETTPKDTKKEKFMEGKTMKDKDEMDMDKADNKNGGANGNGNLKITDVAAEKDLEEKCIDDPEPSVTRIKGDKSKDDHNEGNENSDKETDDNDEDSLGTLETQSNHAQDEQTPVAPIDITFDSISTQSSQQNDDQSDHSGDNTTKNSKKKRRDTSVKELKERRTKAETRVKELESEINELKAERNRCLEERELFENKNQELQIDNGNLSDDVKKLQKDLTKAQEETKKTHQTLKRSEDEHDRLMQKQTMNHSRELHQLQSNADQRCKRLQGMVNALENQVYSINQQLLSAVENNSILTNEKKEIYEEKQTLLLRLSRIAGAHLSHDNPNIADLNDQNRPTKLAEAFSELYDNEWTDAYEVFEDAEDTDGVKTLFNILKSCYSKVQETSTRHTEGIKGSLSVKVKVKERSNPLSSVLTEASGSVEERSNPLSSVETEASVSNEILDTDEHANGEPKKEEDCDEIAGNQNNKPSAPNNKDDDLSDVNEEDPAVHIEKKEECNGLTKSRYFIPNENGCITIATTNEDQAKIQLVEDTSFTKGDVVVQKANTMIDKHAADEQQPLTQKEKQCGTNPAVIEDTQEHVLDTDKTTESDDHTEAQALGIAKGPTETQNIDSQDADTLTDQHTRDKNNELIDEQQPLIQKKMPCETDAAVAENAREHHDTEPTVVTQRQPNVSTEETWKTLTYDFDLLSVTQKQALLEIKKQAQLHVEDDVVKVIKESVLAELDLVDSPIVKEYVTKCCQICWDMYKHSPPVHVEFIDVQENTPMDTNVYKAYTIGGKCLDYVVWPPIYLHENGPMLAKGVAQGKGKK